MFVPETGAALGTQLGSANRWEQAVFPWLKKVAAEEAGASVSATG